MSEPATRRVLLVEEGGVGGVAEYTGELAAALARAGWRVELATARDHGYRPAPGVTVHRLFPYLRSGGPIVRALRRLRLSKPINGVSHLAATVGLLSLARRCDVVHFQGGEWPPLSALQAIAVERLAHRPYVWTPHNTFDRGARASSRSRELIGRLAARVIVHSRHDSAQLSPAVVARATVVPHGEYGGLARRGAPSTNPEQARVELGLPQDALVALLFGQLRSDKGVRDLLVAARATPGVHVILAGEDKGALAEVRDLLAAPEVASRTTLREGFVPDAEAGRIFAAADVVALPYHRASASGVLLLACGYGRPAVAYPVGGLPEYVEDGATGWLCSEASPTALAESLATIAAAGRGECASRGVTARARADERFGWDAIAATTDDVYRRVLAAATH